MKLSTPGFTRTPARDIRRPWLAGALLVYRWRMKQRSALRDLAVAALMAAGVVAAAAALQHLWVDSGEYVTGGPPVLARGIVTASAVAALLLPLAASAMGAVAAPAREEFEAVQTMLITRLTASQVVVGRLVAAAWPAISAGLMLLAGSLIIQLITHPVSGPGNGAGHTVSAYFVVLAMVGMAGTIGFAAALRSRPGRNTGAGTGCASALCLLCCTAVGAISPVLGSMHNPQWLIEAALAVDPVTAAATAFGADYDPLRAPFVYEHVAAHDYLFAYPPALVSAALFVALACVMVWVAATRLNLAYR